MGFSSDRESFSPQQLIEGLDSCFNRFDQITRVGHPEKIKTVGYAYMAVGCVPATNRTHAADGRLAALEIEQLVSGLREKEMAGRRPYWQIRVGWSSSLSEPPAVAGGPSLYDLRLREIAPACGSGRAFAS